MLGSMYFYFKKISQSRNFYLFIFFFTIVLAAAAFIFPEKLEQFRTLGLFGIFLINFFGSATIFVPAPAIISVGIGGGLYNPVLVGMSAAFGATLGDILAYVLGLSTHKLTNLGRFKKLYVKFRFLFKKYGIFMIFIFSFIPNPFFDAVGIFAGISRFSLRTFTIIIFIGRLLRNIIIAYTGARIFA